MKLTLITLLGLCIAEAHAQHKIDIPQFGNLNSQDQYPANSILSTYTSNFDILISLNTSSAWGPDYSIKVLAHHMSGWYKIEINHDKLSFDPYTVYYSTQKINDSIGQIVWDSLLRNHLFDMKDGRQVQSACITTDTIRYQNGEFILKEVFHDSSSDGAEYRFEIITKTTYRQVYFYSPQDLVNKCPEPERRWIINCITTFEKYLGK